MMNLKGFWRGFSVAFKREISVSFGTPVFHWLTWIFPFILFSLFAGLFSSGALFNLPVSVVDKDHSQLSRQIIRELNAAPHAIVTAYDNDVHTSEKRLRSAKDYAFLYLPYNLESDVLNGKQPTVRIYNNELYYGSGTYAAQDFSGLMTSINLEYRSIIATMIGLPLPQLAKVTLSLDTLFNPSGSYIYFQQFSTVIHFLQLFVVTYTIYILSHGTVLQPIKPFALALIGKLFPYTLVFTTLLVVQIGLMMFMFDAKLVGNPFYILVITFFYVIAAQSVGVLLFTWTPNSIMAYTLMGPLVSIAMTFSGTAVPELGMILPAQIILNIEPLTHVLYIMFDIFLREVTAQKVFRECLILLIYPAVVAFLIRNRIFKRLGMQDQEKGES